MKGGHCCGTSPSGSATRKAYRLEWIITPFIAFEIVLALWKYRWIFTERGGGD